MSDEPERINGMAVFRTEFIDTDEGTEQVVQFGNHYPRGPISVVPISRPVQSVCHLADERSDEQDAQKQQEKAEMGGTTEETPEKKAGGTEKAEINRLIPTVIGRIDPIIDAIRAGDRETARRLTDAETNRLTEIRDKLDQEWRVATGKALAAYRFGEFLKDAGPEDMERIRKECG